MEDIKKLIREEVLEKGHLMSLGVQDGGGVWVSDVIYVHDEDFTIYWISDPEVRHSKAIEDDPYVAATITVSNGPGEPNVGVQIAGKAERLDGGRIELERKHARKRGRPLPIDEGKMLEGDSWYKLTPLMIELIYEPLCGFEKQGLDLMGS